MKHWLAHLDKHGWFVPPIWLWGGWILLSRSWWLLVIAGASREHGASLLGLFYPRQSEFYSQLIVAAPIVVLMWMSGVRHKLPLWALGIWRYGRAITLSVLIVDLLNLVQGIWLSPIQAPLPMLITLMLLAWLAFYLLKSRRVKMTFLINESDPSLG